MINPSLNNKEWDKYYSVNLGSEPWVKYGADKSIIEFCEQNFINNKEYNILEAGCGTGKNLLELSKNKQLKLFGLDYSELIKKFWENNPNSNIEFIFENLIQLNKNSFYQIFDGIIDGGALHTINPEYHNLIIQNYFSWLKSDGKLYIRFFYNKELGIIDNLENIPLYGAPLKYIKELIANNGFQLNNFSLDKDYGLTGCGYYILTKQ
jgi:SAM-dependent methyltransferase